MLTPVDVQNRVFKGGIGYDKKDVETFMSELASDYSELYRSNVELKDKVATLDESIQHYKSIEESMQKALTLSEKTAEETVIAANDKARQINNEAEKKAEMLLADAKEELQETKDEIYRLQKQQATFKEQFTKVLEAQLKIMDGEMIDIDLGPGFEPSQNYAGGFGSFSGGGLGSEGGLGGLSGGGGYVGSSSFDDGRERTSQEPAFDRGTLNMDPFAEAANGGGRFSRQTGGAYNGSAGKKKASSGSSSEKSGLNVKESKPGANRVKHSPQATQHVQTNPNMNGAAAQPVKPQPTPQPQATQQIKPTPQPQPVKPQSAPQPQVAQPQQAKPQVAQAAPQPQPAQQVKPQPTQRVKPEPQPVRTTANFVPEEELTQVTGEVEDRVNESNMLDSEDNYSTGFDFVSDDEQTTASAVYDEDTVSGEVEERINESNMIDSEDNYNTGFDFVSDDDQPAEAYGGADEEGPVTGEVEERINESNMIDSEDNYNTGFDFVSDGDMDETVAASPTFEEADEDTYVGEVEDKVNESNMLDSADNYSEGFDFVVGNESEEEIPTILPNFAGGLGGGGMSDSVGSQSDDSASLHIDPFGETASTEEDVFVGDVEDNVKQSNLIGNADDEEEGFNFL